MPDSKTDKKERIGKMGNKLCKSETRSNFTLVELLVVIAIIAILASMILPALRSALDKARAISCTSNHKQLGTATFLYTDDNKGYMPCHGVPASSTVTTAAWATFLWNYVTHETINGNYAYLKQINGGNTFEPKIDIFRCPAVMEPFKLAEEAKHIGRNMFLSKGSYEQNLFISKCRWPSARMMYSDFQSNNGYDSRVAHYITGSAYESMAGFMTYLHPGLTATVTHLDGHVKAWNMHAVPKTSWDSRFWGANPSCTGVNP